MDLRDELGEIRERAATGRRRAIEAEVDLARQRRLLARDNARLVEALEAVVGLHTPRKVICLNPLHDKDCDAEVCDTCDTPWPCPTVRAITEALTTKEAL